MIIHCLLISLQGLDAVGLKPLLASDADLLCEVYADNSRSDRKCVLWTKFELDIDQGMRAFCETV